MIPLYAFLEGDTLGLLLLARPEESCGKLVDKMLMMARTRVQPSGAYALWFGGKRIASEVTVSALKLSALDRVDVRRIEP